MHVCVAIYCQSALPSVLLLLKLAVSCASHVPELLCGEKTRKCASGVEFRYGVAALLSGRCSAVQIGNGASLTNGKTTNNWRTQAFNDRSGQTGLEQV